MTPGPRHTPPSGIGWTESTDEWGFAIVYVAELPGGPVHVLRDQAAVIWLAAVEGQGDIVEVVADMLGHHVDEVHDDVLAFIDELVDRGLLERT